MTIKYPVKVDEFHSDTDGIWWTLEDADGKDICEFPEEAKDDAYITANALNAMNELPDLYDATRSQILNWFEKFSSIKKLE